MHKYLLLFLLVTLCFCARKKAINSNSDSPTSTSRVIQLNTEPVLWKELSPDEYQNVITPDINMPKKFRMFSLDSLEMRKSIAGAPKEKDRNVSSYMAITELPRPDTGLASFIIYETSTMDSALAAHYPNLKTFAGQGIPDQSESVRFDFNENGFNAYITGPNGEWFVTPLKQGITHQYLMVYYKKDLPNSSKTPFELPDSMRK